MIRKDYSVIAEDGLELKGTIYYPDNLLSAKAIVQNIHGINGNIKKDEEISILLAKDGYIVVNLDLRGHGNSTDNKTYIQSYMGTKELLISDLSLSIEKTKKEYSSLPYYLKGHSFGSEVARVFLKEHDSEIDKLLLTGTINKIPFLTYIGYKHSQKIIKNEGELFANDTINSYIFGKNVDWLSDDPIPSYQNDRKLVRKYCNNGAGIILQITAELDERFKAQNPGLPILSINGDQDARTGFEKGLESSKKHLMKNGYYNVSFETVSGGHTLDFSEDSKALKLIKDFYNK